MISLLVPMIFNYSIILLTGYHYYEPRFWYLLGLCLAYQVVYGLAKYYEGRNANPSGRQNG